MKRAMKKGAGRGAMAFVAVPAIAIMVAAVGAIIIVAIPLALFGALVGAVLGPVFSLFGGRDRN